ncbi:hypothetical protein AC579_6149 [Pseudocercospora musae]|uniref:Rhodopsin domain-containing protein n=1 Tax=Pseudocercospora musae TaxID=113226 RepID=A0A139I4Y3_9PEZI|nr:hypothetical protein AC579_6149 [Pseudocercospora musae]
MSATAATPTDPAHIPAASAPPGFTSNLDDPVTKDTTAGIVLAIAGMAISTTFLLIRIYTKAILARIFGIDDVLLIIAWMMSMVVQITIVYYMAVNIIGAHLWDLSLADFNKLVRITAIDSVIYLILMASAKFSILLFYLKLSREKWFTYSIYGVMVLVFGFSTSLALSLMFACTPLKRVWDVTITEGHCINRGRIYLATAGLNAASDILMLFLPMPMLIKLQVPKLQKIGLIFIFSIGSLTMVTSLIRLCLMPPLIKAVDMSWSLATPATWICIEGNLVVICGCLPILRLFLRHVAPRLIGEYGSASGTGRSGRSGNKPGIASSELSNIKSNGTKGSTRTNYARMDEFDIMKTEVGAADDDGSETHMIASNGITKTVNINVNEVQKG